MEEMTTKDNGGPAFPSMRDMRHNPDFDHEEGMTLRDYFAAKAMQGLCANGSTKATEIAQAAYIVADAMLEARKK
jgi:hypothetical protein